MLDQGRCVAVSAHRRLSVRLLWLDPHVLLCVENPQARVILFTVVAAEDPELAVIKCGCMVLYLWCDYWAEHGL